MTKKYDIIETTTVETLWGDEVTRKKIKDDYFRDSNVIAKSQSKVAKSERNDCVVRAFMMSLDLSYDKAHKFVSDKFNRINRNGTHTSVYLENILGKQKNGKRMRLMGYHPTRSFGGRKNLLTLNIKKKRGIRLSLLWNNTQRVITL